MRKYLVTLALLVVVGCTTFVANTQKTEYALAQAADGAMKTWVVYYKSATNNPALYNTTLEKLEAQRLQVDDTAKKIGATLATVDFFVSQYATNSAVQPSLQAALNAAAADVPNLVSLINQFVGKTVN